MSIVKIIKMPIVVVNDKLDAEIDAYFNAKRKRRHYG